MGSIFLSCWNVHSNKKDNDCIKSLFWNNLGNHKSMSFVGSDRRERPKVSPEKYCVQRPDPAIPGLVLTCGSNKRFIFCDFLRDFHILKREPAKINKRKIKKLAFFTIFFKFDNIFISVFNLFFTTFLWTISWTTLDVWENRNPVTSGHIWITVSSSSHVRSRLGES